MDRVFVKCNDPSHKKMQPELHYLDGEKILIFTCVVCSPDKLRLPGPAKLFATEVPEHS